MIENLLSMLLAVWVNIITTGDLEPREKPYDDLIKHLEKLECSLPDEPILKKDKSKDTSPESTSILKKIIRIQNLRSSLTRKPGDSL